MILTTLSTIIATSDPMLSAIFNDDYSWIIFPVCFCIVLYYMRLIIEKSRNRFLHPIPKTYDISPEEAFRLITDYFAETYIGYGNKWRPATIDINDLRLVYEVHWTETREISSSTTLREKRFIQVCIFITPTDDDYLEVQMDWYSESEGSRWFACDSLITSTQRHLDELLEEGSND